MLGGPTSNMSCWDWGRDSESCRLFYLCPNLGRFLLRNNSFFKSQYFKPCNEFKRLSILVQNPAGTFSARHIFSQSFEHYCAREQDVQQVHQKRTQRMLITLLFFGHVSHNHLVISDFFFSICLFWPCVQRDHNASTAYESTASIGPPAVCNLPSPAICPSYGLFISSLSVQWAAGMTRIGIAQVRPPCWKPANHTCMDDTPVPPLFHFSLHGFEKLSEILDLIQHL